MVIELTLRYCLKGNRHQKDAFHKDLFNNNLSNNDLSGETMPQDIQPQTTDVLPFSQACENNKAPILAVLKTAFANTKQVLEIGSGTGQHAVYLRRISLSFFGKRAIKRNILRALVQDVYNKVINLAFIILAYLLHLMYHYLGLSTAPISMQYSAPIPYIL